MKISVMIVLFIAIFAGYYAGVDKNQNDELLQIKQELDQLKKINNFSSMKDNSLEMNESEKKIYDIDKKLWSFMKDLNYANNSYKSDNNSFSPNLEALYPYLNNDFNFTENEISTMVEYFVGPSNQGIENNCYKFSVSFKSEYYSQYNNENKKFSVGNLDNPTCK